MYKNTCDACGYQWSTDLEPGSEKEPGWCPECESEGITTEHKDVCEQCGEPLPIVGSALDAYDVSKFMFCKSCFEEAQDEYDDHGLALAVYLGINPFDLRRCTYNKNSFEVDPHRIKRGNAPSHFVENVAFLREGLAHVGLDGIASRDELLRLFAPPQWKVTLVGLLRKTFPHRRAWAKTLAKHIGLDERAPPDRVYYTILRMFQINPVTAAMMTEGIHRLVNTLYHVCGGREDTYNKHTCEDYAMTFNGGTPPDRRTDSWTNDGDYLVLTDGEADETWDEYLENYIDDVLLPELSESARNYFDREAWKRDARMDGRGHSLSGYDGEENEELYDGEWYYIYRTN